MIYTILLIDDSPDDIEITRRVLLKSGHPVKIVTALRGETALEYLRAGNGLPSLILLDLKMPCMGGIDVLRQIRSDNRLRNIPVAVVTSSSLESDEKNSYEAGADVFLQKDFDIDYFGKNLKAVLDRFLKA